MSVLAFVVGFVKSLIGYGFLWWFSLFATTVLGIGLVSEEYPDLRARLSEWQPWLVLPEKPSAWWLLILYLIWLVARTAWGEGRREMARARLRFEEPFVDRSVPLYSRTTQPAFIKAPGGSERFLIQRSISENIGHNDIAKIAVRNYPYDSESGLAIPDAYVEVRLYEEESGALVKTINQPRWGGNPKPGYEGNPSDHFPEEWNFRTLKPDRRRNTIEFVLKSYEEEMAYGFTGRSQLRPDWKKPELSIRPGTYLAAINVFGQNLRTVPTVKWLRLVNPGQNGGIEVSSTRQSIRRWWYSKTSGA